MLGSRWILAGTVAGAFAMPLLVPPGQAVSAAGVPTCFGRPATIVGTNGSDVLIGTNGADVIVGRGGRDQIRGRSGDDRICAGPNGAVDAHPDPLYESWVGESTFGGRGHDLIDAGRGFDSVSGGPGNDHIWGGRSPALFNEGMEEGEHYFSDLFHQRLRGDQGNDVVHGGPGPDSIRGDGGRDELFTGGYTGYNGDSDHGEFASGGAGDDVLVGGSGDDALTGGDGDDRLLGRGGRDALHGLSGRDELHGGSSTDRSYGDDGHDAIYGGRGRWDRNYGGPGTDLCRSPSPPDSSAKDCER